MKNAIKITRRKLAGVLISFSAVWSGALSSRAFAQTQAPAREQTLAPADPLQAAKDRIKTAGDALAKEQVPMATEPAFQFKA
jgi:hypothetical protein